MATVTDDHADDRPGDDTDDRPGDDADAAKRRRPNRTGIRIAIGLILGLAAGILFGEYCAPLKTLGDAYVGLLQMTVLPYLILSLVSNMARLNAQHARRLGITAVLTSLVLWTVAISLIVVVALMLPPIDGASFYSAGVEQTPGERPDFISTFIPTNVFRSLSNEYIPAVVVFCLFFGCALMMIPGKEPLLQFMDLCSDAIGHINTFLVKLAPAGLFAVTAAAAGTLHLDELSRLQAYILTFTVACLAAAFGALPALLTSIVPISYGRLLRAAQEPMLTAIATGKLFVVLPQVTEKCDELMREQDDEEGPEDGVSTAGVLVPLAYPFPHVGKILAFTFISFAAWYVGRSLTPVQTASMAATGAVSSFASPLLTIPYMLDRYQLPQDMLALFILPGFLTMRMGDVVGVMHLMALTLIVGQLERGRYRIRWARLCWSTLAILGCLFLAGVAVRGYLQSTTIAYDLDRKLLRLEIPSPHEDVVVYESRDEAPAGSSPDGSTIERVKRNQTIRVGYHRDHLPYSFVNLNQHLVGLDVELMHRLAEFLDVRLEFIPFSYDSLTQQLDSGEIDVAAGGIMMRPERLLKSGYTKPYQTATIAVVVPDYRRQEAELWTSTHIDDGVRLATVNEDFAVAAKKQLPGVEVDVIDSIGAYFRGETDEVDGLLLAAEEAAAWNILYPAYTVVIPQPAVRRPVGLVARNTDPSWLIFLDRFLDFEISGGNVDQMRKYWVEGGGTRDDSPRWCVMRDVLGWLP